MLDESDELALFREYRATGSRATRNELVERYMGLAVHIAKRYRRPGSEDDVRQAAMIGLVKAVDRFDPEYGATFVTFAGTTIEGELKRYLRDRTWVVRVPRAAKELHLLVRRASDELHQLEGRSPSVDEIAAHLSVSRDDVLRGLSASAAYEVGTIDARSDVDGVQADRSAALATDEAGFGHVVDAHTIAGLLQRLPAREREIVRRRFYEDMSQAEIAEAVGISQMHVSRLLRRSFELMRTWIDAEDQSPPVQ
jgi:RNA polymerase sigma-B factor